MLTKSRITKLLSLFIPLYVIGTALTTAFSTPDHTERESALNTHTKNAAQQAGQKNNRKQPVDVSTAFQQYRYGPNDYQEYYLSRPNANHPNGNRLVILMHGGNFLYGSALGTSMEPLATFFLERGYRVASIEYRPLTISRWPAPITDIAEGIQAVQSRMGSTVQDITYVGFSAGAVAGPQAFFLPRQRTGGPGQWSNQS